MTAGPNAAGHGYRRKLFSGESAAAGEQCSGLAGSRIETILCLEQRRKSTGKAQEKHQLAGQL